jgi:hypothetical protein
MMIIFSCFGQFLQRVTFGDCLKTKCFNYVLCTICHVLCQNCKFLANARLSNFEFNIGYCNAVSCILYICIDIGNIGYFNAVAYILKYECWLLDFGFVRYFNAVSYIL